MVLVNLKHWMAVDLLISGMHVYEYLFNAANGSLAYVCMGSGMCVFKA